MFFIRVADLTSAIKFDKSKMARANASCQISIQSKISLLEMDDRSIDCKFKQAKASCTFASTYF